MSRDDDDLEDDGGEESRPSRYRRSKKTSPVIWIFLAAVALLLLGCCGVGAYFAFVRKAGTGVFSAGNSFTITGAKIKAVSLPEGKYSPSVSIDFKTNASADSADYTVVVQSHYAKAAAGRDVTPVLKSSAGGSFTGVITGGGMPETPCDVWIERRNGGVKTVVSNVFTIE